MPASRASLRPRGFCCIPVRVTLIIPTSNDLPFLCRNFSWRANLGWGSPHVGKVYQAFYTRLSDAQTRRQWQKQCMKLPELARYCVRPQQGWRKTSSWGRSSKPSANQDPAEKAQQKGVEDWYNVWEKQKTKSFEELVKHIEQDPYRALFGRSNNLLGWLDGRSAFSRSTESYQDESRAAPARPQPDHVQQRPVGPETWTSARTKSVDTQEYDIDPITLRKVPKQSSPATPGNNVSKQVDNETFSIRVRTLEQPASIHKIGAKIPSSRAEASADQKTHQDWLAHEGFREQEEEPKRPKGNAARVETRHQPSKIETALDRHVSTHGTLTAQKPGSKAEYNPKENKEDDVDLLRASDIRASAGSRNYTTIEDPSLKTARHKALAGRYEKQASELNSMLAEEVASKGKGQKPLSGPAVLTSGKVGAIRAKLVPLKTKIDILSEDYAALRRELLAERHRIEEASKKKAAREMLDQEVKSQQDAMKAIEVRGSLSSNQNKVAPKVPHEELHGEGDMASNVHEFAGRARWYKRKAPHAQCEMDARLDRLAKEKAFVGQIREIYEDTYGTISTDHRQPPPDAEATSSNEPTAADSGEARLSNILKQNSASDMQPAVTQSQTPDVPSRHEQPLPAPKTVYYRILAYDSTLQKVNSAKTSSRTPFAGEKPLTPLQALNGLQNPGKFLPHLMVLHNKGYDIISGARDTLILKKVRDAIVPKEDYLGRPNPVDGTTTPQVSTGNFASPTGFVNHNPIILPEEQEPQRSQPRRSRERVRREEEVFSASRRNWQEAKRTTKKDKRKVRRRRTLKHVLLAGTVTAAACYSAGLISEMMSM